MSLSDLTFVIITHNEEDNIERCLASLPKESQILVLDSGSQDNTVQKALAKNARVEHRIFDNYATQRNAAIKMVETPWVFMIDADETISCDMLESLHESFKGICDNSAFQIKRTLVFQGKKLRFGRSSDNIIRLFRTDKGIYENPIHETLRIEGSVGQIKGTLWHYSYKNLEDYFIRFNKYTSLIAKNHREKKRKASTLNFLFRFWFEFLNRYILRLGFLDGAPGYTYAMISSFYAWTKFTKLKELENKQ